MLGVGCVSDVYMIKYIFLDLPNIYKDLDVSVYRFIYYSKNIFEHSSVRDYSVIIMLTKHLMQILPLYIASALKIHYLKNRSHF